MPADTPTLNRAANQITTGGTARLNIEDVRDIFRESGKRMGTFGEVADVIARLLGREVHYRGSDYGEAGPQRNHFGGTFFYGLKEGVRHKSRSREAGHDGEATNA